MGTQETLVPVEASPDAAGPLEITVKQGDLLRELNASQGVVERKTTIPILSNYLFEASGDRLTLTATDLDLALRTSCAAKVKREGSCAVPARRLLDYVKLLPADAEIAIKVLENKWVSIRCGRSNTKMVGMARTAFPTVQPFPQHGGIALSTEVMRGLLRRTSFAVSNEESRYTLNGAMMSLKSDSITFVATDGHRLAHVQHAAKLDGVSGENKTLVPKKALEELRRILDSTDSETVDFAKDDSTLYFRAGSRALTSRVLAGQFPNFEAVLPKDPTKIVTLPGDALMSAVMRVAQFADERSRAVRLRLEAGELKLSASSSESGESEDSIEVAYTGEPMTIGFNAVYIADFLKAVDDKEVRLEMKDSQTAGQLVPTGQEYRFRYVVMPMRI